MGLIQARKDGKQSGIALFIVIAAMAVLAILVTEFVYIAQVHQRMAYEALDQLKAHYLAKSGFKISLLRIKAYQNLKGVAGGGDKGGSGGAGGIGLPKMILEKIWSFPFMYPLPSNIPGMTDTEKDQIQKFEKASGLGGRFTAAIDSETSKYNLNMILAPFAPSGPKGPTGSSGPSNPAAPPSDQNNANSGVQGESGPTGFDPEGARESLKNYLTQLLEQKIESDEDFADEYRNFKMDELMENIKKWADRSYEPPGSGGEEYTKPKRAPFYSVAELHMIAPMDDKLYKLFTPGLTVSTTPGINVNTMAEPTLRALFPMMTKGKNGEPGEVEDFFKYRDSLEEDNFFKSADDFFNYITKAVGYFRGDQEEVKKYRKELEKRNIRVVVDETHFKITVQAHVQKSVRLLEAWVTLDQAKGGSPNDKNKADAQNQSPAAPPNPAALAATKSSSGLKVTFMRIL